MSAPSSQPPTGTTYPDLIRDFLSWFSKSPLNGLLLFSLCLNLYLTILTYKLSQVGPNEEIPWNPLDWFEDESVSRAEEVRKNTDADFIREIEQLRKDREARQ